MRKSGVLIICAQTPFHTWSGHETRVLDITNIFLWDMSQAKTMVVLEAWIDLKYSASVIGPIGVDQPADSC